MGSFQSLNYKIFGDILHLVGNTKNFVLEDNKGYLGLWAQKLQALPPHISQLFVTITKYLTQANLIK
jgi:hypothetical protein